MDKVEGGFDRVLENKNARGFAVMKNIEIHIDTIRQRILWVLKKFGTLLDLIVSLVFKGKSRQSKTREKSNHKTVAVSGIGAANPAKSVQA